jgi:hypothetical protein
MSWNATQLLERVLETDELITATEFIDSLSTINNLTSAIAAAANDTYIPESEEAASAHQAMATLIKHQYVLLGWISLIIVVVGIFGNAFVIKILCSPQMRANSTNVFLTGLATADLLALCIMLFLIPLRYILVSHGSLLYYEIHTLMFPYLYPLCTTLQFCSIYLTVAACINRNIIVYSAVEGHGLVTHESAGAVKAVIGIFLVSAVVCVPFWFEYHAVVVHDGKCDFSHSVGH